MDGVKIGPMPWPWRRLGGALLRFDWRGEGAVAALTFLAGALLRLGSSLVLTRLLYPEAYGIVALLASLLFVIEMLSDVGVVGLLIRHERGGERAFVDTLWTVRLVRGVANFALLFGLADLIASLLGAPALGGAIRVVSFYFLLNAVESMTFATAVRERRSRWVNLIEFGCAAATTLFVIAWSWFSRDHWGMVAGMLFGRALQVLLSWTLAPRSTWPRWRLERAALKDTLGFAKYVMPSSLLTMLLSQFDRIVFLRLFDLRMLGLYGVAQSLSSPPEGLASKISQTVLYPRCAEVFRRDPAQLRRCFYRDNAKLLVLMAAIPAAIGGAGQFIVDLLFDPRYREAGLIVQVLMLRTLMLSLLRPSEQLQTAAGHPSIHLLASLLRLGWLVPASLAGWYLFGFTGFLVGAALEPLPALVATWRLQAERGLFDARWEALRAIGAALLWALCWLASQALWTLVTAWR
jgi:O-antigen/teichoic acid export membrane protein